MVQIAHSRQTRSGHPCRINVAVFGRPWVTPTPTQAEASEQILTESRTDSDTFESEAGPSSRPFDKTMVPEESTKQDVISRKSKTEVEIEEEIYQHRRFGGDSSQNQRNSCGGKLTKIWVIPRPKD